MDQTKGFVEGMRDGIPIALGYFAVSFTLGIACRNIGMSALQATVMSLTNLTSAGEFAALGIMAALVAFYQTRRLRFRTRKQKKLFEFGKWAVIFGMIALAGANYFQHTSLEQALVNSNRMGLFSINLPVLLRENKLWLGLVYASAGRFGEGRIGLYQVYYVDNYYVYLLMSSGVLGCAIQLAAIFLVVQGIRTTV